nr:immunoglobulin heavy chain junction region [Macaca mulatta]MOW33052.1 immunoglobulin heavy chain junction region [Macaca mulatta]MOW33117.1 immunoglobulin heavy chain junction region [Macaca mulatta]
CAKDPPGYIGYSYRYFDYW